METAQMQVWSGDFGRQYTDRNRRTLAERDARCKELVGVTRSELNAEFLGGLDRSMRILEIGCNVGHQLLFLRQMGFTDLFGIELQPYAARQARAADPTLNIAAASGLDLPFPDRSFDLVFTSVFLIHIAPGDLGRVLGEIARTARSYVFGYEYYAESLQEISYRGHGNLLWKGNYRRLLQDRDPGLALVGERMLPYLQDENVDCMYLLRREGA